MKLTKTLRTTAAIFMLVALASIVGCLVSKVPLGNVEDAKVDVGYIGNWRFNNDDGTNATLILRNIDDKRYYAEWKASDETSRSIGFITEVAGVQFAQLRPLTPDGSRKEEYTIFRVAKKDGKLEVR